MHYRVHRLLPRVAQVLPERSRHPAVGEAHRLRELLPRDVVAGQLVEGDDDVRAEVLVRVRVRVRVGVGVRGRGRGRRGNNIMARVRVRVS